MPALPLRHIGEMTARRLWRDMSRKSKLCCREGHRARQEHVGAARIADEGGNLGNGWCRGLALLWQNAFQRYAELSHIRQCGHRRCGQRMM